MVAAVLPPVADIVFLVEGTANLGAYFDNLKTSYIQPTLEYFNGGPADNIDYGSDYSCTLYSLVTFQSADCAPEPSVKCSTPSTNICEVLQWMNNISFIGGGAGSTSHTAEALSTALHVFDDYKKLREPNNSAQKHCILVCNSSPYETYSREDVIYHGYTANELASILGERGINLSIISPRKIPALCRLYEQACKEGLPDKDYTKEKTHLVLLKGFQLQERVPSPTSVKEEDIKISIANPIQKLGSPAAVSGSVRNLNSPISGGLQQSGTDKSQFRTLPKSEPQQPNSSQASMPMHQQLQHTPTSYQNTPATVQVSNTRPSTGIPNSLNQSQAVRPALPQAPQQRQAPPQKALEAVHNILQESSLQSAGRGGRGTLQTQVRQPGLSTVGNMSPMRVVGPVSISQSATPAGLSPQIRASIPRPNLQTQQLLGTHPQRMTSQPQMMTSQSQMITSQSQMITSQSQMITSQPQIMTSQQSQQQMIASQPSIINNQSQLNRTQGPSQMNLTHSQQMTTSQPQQSLSQNVNQLGLSQQSVMISRQPQSISQMGTQPSQPQVLTSQPVMPISNTNVVQDISIEDVINNPQAQLQVMEQNATVRDKKQVWSGALEWQEKSKNPLDPTGKIARSLACRVMVGQNEPDVNASNWPNKLLMQSIPQALLTPLQHHFRDSRTVTFFFNNNDIETFKSLCRVLLTSRLAGCVHFPPVSQCDVRVLMLMYSKRKKSFIGLIPNDQNAVMNGIKQVVLRTKQSQQEQLRGMILQQQPQQPLQQVLAGSAGFGLQQQQQQQQQQQPQQPQQPQQQLQQVLAGGTGFNMQQQQPQQQVMFAQDNSNLGASAGQQISLTTMAGQMPNTSTPQVQALNQELRIAQAREVQLRQQEQKRQQLLAQQRQQQQLQQQRLQQMPATNPSQQQQMRQMLQHRQLMQQQQQQQQQQQRQQQILQQRLPQPGQVLMHQGLSQPTQQPPQNLMQDDFFDLM